MESLYHVKYGVVLAGIVQKEMSQMEKVTIFLAHRFPRFPGDNKEDRWNEIGV